MHLFGALAHSGHTLVWHLHDYLGSRPLSARLLRVARAQCAVVIANSASVADDVRQVLAGVTVVVVRNAVDLERFSPIGRMLDLDDLAGLAPPLRGRFGSDCWPPSRDGRATRRSLRAIARVPRTVALRAYIIGGPVYDTLGSQYSRQELVSLVEALHIGDRVAFTGVVSAPDAALRALDLAVHASTAPEPFGLVIAEAMACGRAVIVSFAGGAAEIVTDNVDARRTHPATSRGWPRVSPRWPPMVGGAVARAGRATAVRSFDRARLSAELVPIYRQVAGRRP